jgi:regulation of enolase protein 1 (concanavalin A-like superfamily)
MTQNRCLPALDPAFDLRNSLSMKLPTQRLCPFLCVLSVSLIAHAGSQFIRTIPGWGQVIDPDGDCTITPESGKVTITVPGTTHDLSSYHSIYKKRNAPRILREVDGDFTVEVKVSGAFDPGQAATLPETDPFNGAGLLLWANDENFLRLERNVWTTSHDSHSSYEPLFEYWKDDKDLTPDTTSTKPFFEGMSMYLRLTRQGDQIRAAVSKDGTHWTKTNSTTVQFPHSIKVGVDAINTSKQPFTVEFADFKFVSEK